MRTLSTMVVASALLFGMLTGVLALCPTVISTGIITASGNGKAHVRIFQGSATFSGQGLLRVSAAAQVQITGNAGKESERTSKNGKTEWVIYRRFNGTAVITGQDVHVFLTGSNIQVSAQGDGRAHFIGNGSYTIQTQGKATENGQWAPKPAQKLTGKAYLAFWNSIRRVYGVYEFRNGKDDEDGNADLD